MNEKVVGFLSRIYSDMPREDIEDALQDAALQVIETGEADKYNNSYRINLASFKLRDLRKYRVRHGTPVSLDAGYGEWIEETQMMTYDPIAELDMMIDIWKALSPFTPRERGIIITYFAEGTSTWQIARENPERSQPTWYRWLEKKVKPALQKALADYQDIFSEKNNERKAG